MIERFVVIESNSSTSGYGTFCFVGGWCGCRGGDLRPSRSRCGRKKQKNDDFLSCVSLVRVASSFDIIGGLACFEGNRSN